MIRRLHGNAFGGVAVEIIFDAEAQVSFESVTATVEADYSYTKTEEFYDTDGTTLLETHVTTASASGSSSKTVNRIPFTADFIGGTLTPVSMPDDTFCVVREGRFIWPALIGGQAEFGTALGLGHSIEVGPRLLVAWGSGDGENAIEVNINREVTPPSGDPDYDSITQLYHYSVEGSFNIDTTQNKIRWMPNVGITLGTDLPVSDPILLAMETGAYSPEFHSALSDVQRSQLAFQEFTYNVPSPPDGPGPFIVTTWDFSGTLVFRLEAA